MRAMILAAGRGERMRPLTDATPKPLLKVAGKCLIDYHLEKFARAGIRDVVINVSWLAEQIIAHVADGARFGVRVHWSYEAVPLETGGGVATAIELLGNGPFVVICADVYTEFDYAKLHAMAASLDGHIGANLLLVPRQTSLVGEYQLDGQRLYPAASGSAIEATYTWASLGVFRTELFNALPQKQPFRLMPHFIEWMAASLMTGELYRGLWENLGDAQQLDELNTKLAGSD
jgi:N-acetyl-alpha-D-muramate 1-phosphate uridylyltransferase